MLMAITREVSASIERCALTHLSREPIDLERARAQHAAYEWALVDAGCTVRRLGTTDALADSVFVEDVAIVCDELAIVTRPGAESRRQETTAVADWLSHVRPVRFVEAPATLDGGDVLMVGRQVFVGLSERTTEDGASQLRHLLAPHGYEVVAVRVDGCLHLKSAVTALSEDTLLINRAWTAAAAFEGFTLIDVDPGEPYAANALGVAGRVLYPASFPRTRGRLEQHGFDVRTLEVGELAKAEGALTCCSLIFNM